MDNDEFEELSNELNAWAEASVAMASEFMGPESWGDPHLELGLQDNGRA
jgi:hypothetical protein